jgi:prevent-host-death family protein
MFRMTRQVNVVQAKATLSELIEAAEAGDEVIIARAGVPAVRLVPVVEPAERALGFLRFTVDDALFDALSSDEADEWA